GKGLYGYTFGPLMHKHLEIYYVEVEKGHDTFMISKRITRIYYVVSGHGYFTIGNRKYDVACGSLVEVPPKVENSYSGQMKLVVTSCPRWFSGNDTYTKWNPDVIQGEFSVAANGGSWKIWGNLRSTSIWGLTGDCGRSFLPGFPRWLPCAHMVTWC